MADKEYTLSVREYVEIRNVLSAIPEIRSDIKEIKKELAVKNHVVIDNTTKTDWKVVATVATAVVGALGTLYITIKGSL